MKLFLFFPFFLFAVTMYPDFSICYKKYKNYSTIPISKNYSISATKPKHYEKYIEKLGIYLIKKRNNHFIHFKKSHLGVWIASISKNSIYSGNYAEYQTSLFNPAKISTKTTTGSIITDIFCRPIGVGVKGGFISKSYFNKLILYKVPTKTPLKRVGILFDNNFIVTKIIPNSLASKHYISVGSKILKINNKKVSKEFPKIIKSVTILQNGIEFRIKVDK